MLDPSAFAVLTGPSIAETLMRHGAVFRRADNTRSSSISHDRRKGGWDQLRARLKGDGDGRPLIYFFSTCRDIIRTLPLLQHDTHNAEDVDTDGDDHCGDSVRYACLSRPYLAHEPFEDENSRSPYLVANAFRFSELRD